MKKYLSSILITFIILANLLSPISVGWNNKGVLDINKTNIAEAAFTTYYYTNTVEAQDWDGKKEKIVENSENFNTKQECEASRTKSVTNSEKGVVVSSCLSHESSSPAKEATIMPECGITSGTAIMGCGADAIYYIIFMPTSFLFGLAGKFFDITFAYSVSSAAYSSPFITKGWGIVRDFVNMFFIFILLYIAFGTILDLNGSKTKEMIINVIIIGLLINFSLFAAKVVIDTSNIMARVFYNASAMSGVKVEKDGTLSMSVTLVNHVDPQTLILNAKRVGSLPDKGNQTTKPKNGEIGLGTFVLVTLLASAVNIVGFIVFLTVALVFVGRVIGLWIAMIIAPLAFLSYTVPAMQKIEMIGWKNWWPELLRLSFVAPLFIFFIYLIIQFLNTGFIGNTNGLSGLNYVVNLMLPFAFIMILMLKAKSIAVKMSGSAGEILSKAGSAVGGMALGAATGGAALAMRAGVGRAGSAIANSERVKKMASSKNKFKKFIGNKTMNTGQSIGKKSFDLRNTKLGASAGKGLGVDLGKGKTGGFDKAKADQIAKDKRRAQELKVGDNSKDKKDLNRAEEDHQELLTENKTALDKFDKDIEEAGATLRNASDQFGSGSEQAKKAGLELTNTKARKKAFVEGKDYEGDITGYKQVEIGKKKVKKTRKVNKPIENDLFDAQGNKTMKDNYVDEEYEEEESIMGDDRDEPIRSKENKRINSNINAGDARDKDGNYVYEKDKNGNDVYEKDKNGNDVYEKDKNGKSTDKKIKVVQKRTIDYLEKIEIRKAREVVVKENKKRTTGYASDLDSKGSKMVNFIFSGGQSSGTGANTAAHNIRMDQKLDTGTKV